MIPLKIILYLWSSPIPIKLTTADVIKVTIIPDKNLNFFTSTPKEVAESSPVNNKL